MKYNSILIHIMGFDTKCFKLSSIHFSRYLLNGAFVGFKFTFCPPFLGAATWDFFCTTLLFVFSTSGHLCTLLLVFSSQDGFFNIFPLMLPAPISYNMKFVLLEISFEIIIVSSS